MFLEAFLLYLAAASSWFRPVWKPTTGILVAAYALGLALGFVQPAGIAAIAALMLLALLCGRTPGGTRGVALHGTFFLLAVLLSAHWVPGFRNPTLLGPTMFTSDAYPFRMYLNLDKSAVGFSLLLLYTPLCRETGIARALLVGTGGAALAIVLLLPLALQLHAVQWGRGSKVGYSWSRVDASRTDDGTLTFSGAVRDGSMCWCSGAAARG